MYEAKPLWQHWWYASNLCGGTLDSADLADVLPDERLEAGPDRVDLADGGLDCAILTDDDHRALSVEVMSGGGAIGMQLEQSFTIPHEPRFVFPDGTPGFNDQFGPVILQECPKLGRDDLGRKQRLLTRVLGPVTTDDPEPALLRIAVSAANATAEKYGCGARKLPLPDRVNEPENRPLTQAARSKECAWLADARLPKNPSGGPWEFSERAAGDVPVTSCVLIDPTKGENGREAAEFTGWYGDWTREPFETLIGANVDTGDETDDAVMAERLGRATARCDDEDANFLAYGKPRENDYADLYLTGSQLRPLLAEFAADQKKRHGCAELNLPGPTIHPMRDR